MKQSQKNEALLIFGRWTSKIGDIVFDYVNNVTIVSLCGKSAFILAIYQSSEIIVNTIFNLLGGVIADRSYKKKILIRTDLLSASICITLSFFVTSTYLTIALILANIFLAVTFSFNSPTYKSIVREMIEKDRIGHFNSVSNGGIEVIKMIGPVLGLCLLDIVGTRGALLINGMTFFLSAIAECAMLPLNQRLDKKKKSNVFMDIIDGFKYLVHKKEIFFLVILSALVNFFLSGYNLLIPYTDVVFKEEFTGFYSKILVMEAIGGILGSFISSKIFVKLGAKYKILIFFLMLTGISLVLVPLATLTKNIVCCLLPFLAFGTALTIFN